MASTRFLALALFFNLILAFDAGAQTKKRQPKTRRGTSAVAVRQQPSTLSPMLEPEVVSRAEDDLNSENGTVSSSGINPDSQKTPLTAPIKTVVVPTSKNNSAEEKEDRSLLDMERLSLAEGHAENFRRQLSDVIEREAVLRSKIEQLDFQMRPEVIQAETATIGSLRPEELRDSRRKMLENEKTRANDQLTKTLENRTRLETAIVNADALVDKLRARVEAETNDETQKSSRKISSKDSGETSSPDN